MNDLVGECFGFHVSSGKAGRCGVFDDKFGEVFTLPIDGIYEETGTRFSVWAGMRRPI